MYTHTSEAWHLISKILLESNPLKFRILGRGLAVASPLFIPLLLQCLIHSVTLRAYLIKFFVHIQRIGARLALPVIYIYIHMSTVLTTRGKQVESKWSARGKQVENIFPPGENCWPPGNAFSLVPRTFSIQSTARWSKLVIRIPTVIRGNWLVTIARSPLLKHGYRLSSDNHLTSTQRDYFPTWST